MELFPHVLIRLAGASFNSLSLGNNDALRQIQALQSQHAELQARKAVLSEDIFRLLQHLTDKQIQNQLQQVRRDLFNNRPLKAATREILPALLPTELSARVETYLAAVQAHGDAQQRLYATYDQLLLEERRTLQRLTTGEHLQKGLLLSSDNLLGRLSRYGEMQPDHVDKKNRRSEFGLLRYVTRLHTKTSPFSTFTGLGMGRLVPELTPLLRLGLDGANIEAATVSHVTLSNRMLRHIQALLYSTPEAYLELPLQINATVSWKDDHLAFLCNNDNVEAFQHIPRTPVLDFLVQTIREASAGGGSITLNQVVAESSQHISASAEQLLTYLRRLLAHGLLEFRLGVSSLNPYWAEKLLELLHALPATQLPAFAQFLDTLRLLKQQATRYGLAGVSERELILSDTFTAFQASSSALLEAGTKAAEVGAADTAPTSAAFVLRQDTKFRFRPHQLYYEDALVRMDAQLNQEQVAQFARKLNELLQSYQSAAFNTDKEHMKLFFLRQYGPGEQVSVLDFHEKFFRNIKAIQANPPPLAFSTAPIKAHLRQVLATALTGGTDQLNLTYEMLALPTQLGQPTAQNQFLRNSYGCVVQFYQPAVDGQSGALQGVINSLGPGYGKMLSRFMHLFPASVLESLRHFNERMAAPAVLLVENSDASYFNANIHPPLFPFEIRVPGGHNSLPPEQQLPVADFRIAYDEALAELILLHAPTSKRVYMFDVGFESLTSRSKLFRILQNFSQDFFSPHNLLRELVYALVDQQHDGSSAVVAYPRIVYEGQIIFFRRSWHVPRALLPLRKTGEESGAYFQRLNHWRQAHGIPEEVFISLNSPLFRHEAPAPSATEASFDDYKPQYINFASPLLVQLLERQLAKVPFKLRIEEMLPHRSQLLPIKQESFVSEYILQWHT